MLRPHQTGAVQGNYPTTAAALRNKAFLVAHVTGWVGAAVFVRQRNLRCADLILLIENRTSIN